MKGRRTIFQLVGFRLGKGERLDDIIATLGSVAEGVTTAKGAKKMVEELGVNAPLVSGVSLASVPSQPGTDDSSTA